MKLTHTDVKALKNEPSVAMRATLAGKVALSYAAGAFSASDMQLATEIFNLLLRDVEVKVRRALADNLKHAMHLPRDIAHKLATDVAEIANPMLEYSYALTEEDLIEIAKSTKVSSKLLAIARRGSISPELSRTLIHSHNEQVLFTLFCNKGASIAESDLETILAHIDGRETLLEALVNRGGLPLTLVDRLFDVVNDRLKKVLTGKYRLSKRLAEDVTNQATLSVRVHEHIPSASDDDLEFLVDRLEKSGALGYTVLIRALCSGDLRFFEAAFARLAGIPLINARILMLDPGPLGFKALYDISPLPATLYEAIKTLFEAAQEITSYGKLHREDFRARMIERIMAGRFDMRVEHMPYLMSILGKDLPNVQTIN